ncbi:MAG: site-2 protease family protein [Candidatus Aenigmatarchaeota archaeon]
MNQEIKDLAISAVVLAFVFAYSGLNLNFINDFPAALIAVSLGFILHELGHRAVAKKFHCHAEYRIWKEGLMLALLITLATSGAFVFAALGAVMIHSLGPLSRKRIGLISLTGPAMNILLAFVFLLLNFLFPLNVFYMGAYVNVWLALFNLFPIPPLDGSKIFFWNKAVWVGAFALTIIMFILVGI